MNKAMTAAANWHEAYAQMIMRIISANAGKRGVTPFDAPEMDSVVADDATDKIAHFYTYNERRNKDFAERRNAALAKFMLSYSDIKVEVFENQRETLYRFTTVRG